MHNAPKALAAELTAAAWYTRTGPVGYARTGADESVLQLVVEELVLKELGVEELGVVELVLEEVVLGSACW